MLNFTKTAGCLVIRTAQQMDTKLMHPCEKFCENLLVKEPVKLIKRLKIAHSFLQSVSNQFHVIILTLPM